MGLSRVCCPNGHSIKTLTCKMIREVAGKLAVILGKPLKGSEGPSPTSAEHEWVDLKMEGTPTAHLSRVSG